MEPFRKDRLYSDLLEASAKPGCPICRVSLAFVRSYLDNTMYERVNDGEVRAELRNARGYCNTHAWMLSEGRGVVLGTAIIQRDVLNTVLEALNVEPPGRGTRHHVQELLRRLRPTAECPACVNRRVMEDIAIGTFLKYLDDPELAAALDSSDGLCLPHFSRALELVEEPGHLHRLLDFQRRALTKLRNELAELIRKHDYRFTSEGLGKESDSWLRALGIVSAERGAR
ncbi:MAG: DUF6062 family protein [Anaerolineae bacterium]|nr:DUF6062 family protein [Anaerolineae bacterium]